jgi:preprotein translocase subunit Sec63
MREDQRFEIERAYDLLPHVVGASWACVWFRLNQIKKPTKEEFRQKVIEYLTVLEKLYQLYPSDEQFSEIISYMKNRHVQEIQKILDGKNPEIEKRYDRYVDYG